MLLCWIQIQCSARSVFSLNASSWCGLSRSLSHPLARCSGPSCVCPLVSLSYSDFHSLCLTQSHYLCMYVCMYVCIFSHSEQNAVKRRESWRALESLYREGTLTQKKSDSDNESESQRISIVKFQTNSNSGSHFSILLYTQHTTHNTQQRLIDWYEKYFKQYYSLCI
jgi:hypothetical protein